MLKRLSGQELFIVSAGILALVFIYLVLIMTEHSSVTYVNNDVNEASIQHEIKDNNEDTQDFTYYTVSNGLK